MLRVTLLQIAKTADELLARDVFVVGKEVSLRSLTGVVDEDVCIGRHSCDGADHVAIFIVSLKLFWTRKRGEVYSFRI